MTSENISLVWVISLGEQAAQSYDNACYHQSSWKSAKIRRRVLAVRLTFSPGNLAKGSAFLSAAGLALLAAAWLARSASPALLVPVIACWLASLTLGVIALFKGRRWAIVLPVVFTLLAVGVPRYRLHEEVVWINVAAYAHSQRGAIKCGRIAGTPPFHEPQAEADEAIRCALSAHNQRRPFVVMFSIHGSDGDVSNAVVGDSDGNAVEIFYATGDYKNAHKMMSHRCGSLQVEPPPQSYMIPVLHCADWRTANYQGNYLLGLGATSLSFPLFELGVLAAFAVYVCCSLFLLRKGTDFP